MADGVNSVNSQNTDIESIHMNYYVTWNDIQANVHFEYPISFDHTNMNRYVIKYVESVTLAIDHPINQSIRWMHFPIYMLRFDRPFSVLLKETMKGKLI